MSIKENPEINKIVKNQLEITLLKELLEDLRTMNNLGDIDFGFVECEIWEYISGREWEIEKLISKKMEGLERSESEIINKKIAKYGPEHIIIIPRRYIKDGLIDPSEKYDIPIKTRGKGGNSGK